MEHPVKEKPNRAIPAQFQRKTQSVMILLIAAAEAAFSAIAVGFAVEFCMIGVIGRTGIW